MEWLVHPWGYEVVDQVVLASPDSPPEFLTLAWAEHKGTLLLANSLLVQNMARGQLNFNGPWVAPIQRDGRYALPNIKNPLQNRTLHRDFAALDGSNESILGFANRYGPLGVAMVRDPNPTSTQVRLLEPLAMWTHQIHFFGTLLDAWREVNDESAAKLRWQVKVYESLKALPAEPMTLQSLRFDILRSGGQWTSNQARYISERITLSPTGYTLASSFRFAPLSQLWLDPRINGFLAELVRPTIRIEPGSPIELRPANLLGAIYASFAEEIIGASRPLRKCPGCGKWFQPLDIRKRTCSDRCRQRAWRIVKGNATKPKQRKKNNAKSNQTRK